LQKKVLAVYYSQSGQLKEVLDSVLGSMKDANIHIEVVEIKPKKAFPYPWSFFDFMGIFPECVYMDGCETESVEPRGGFDLIILAYQPWFLSPSLPISGFLKTDEAAILLSDKPVITLIACRNMWIMAQEKIKKTLEKLNAKLIGNIVLVDQGSSLATFITTPRWMLTGRKDALWGILPQAGVAKNEIRNASRFGVAIKESLLKNELNEDVLKGLKAADSDKELIRSEEIGHKSFLIWGKLVKTLSTPNTIARKISVSIYLVFLVLLIVTIVPINMVLQRLLSKFLTNNTDSKKAYYDAPSGCENFRMKDFV
jgi:hypothetical protein